MTHRYAPDDREQHGSAADEIHQEQDLPPESVFARALLRLLDDDIGHVSQNLHEPPTNPHQSQIPHQKHVDDVFTHTNLQRNDNHEDLLFFVRQDVFHKGKTGADESQRDEQQSPLQPDTQTPHSHDTVILTSSFTLNNMHLRVSLSMRNRRKTKVCYAQVSDVVHDGPAFNRMTFRVDEVIVDLRGRQTNTREEETNTVTPATPATCIMTTLSYIHIIYIQIYIVLY